MFQGPLAAKHWNIDFVLHVPAFSGPSDVTTHRQAAVCVSCVSRMSHVCESFFNGRFFFAFYNGLSICKPLRIKTAVNCRRSMLSGAAYGLHAARPVRAALLFIDPCSDRGL